MPTRRKRNKPNLSPTHILSANTPLLTAPLHDFLLRALTPTTWTTYSESEKLHLISLLPPRYRPSTSTDLDRSPLDASFLQSDSYVRAGVARFKRDVEAGCWAEKWQREARQAMRERRDGKFDEFLREGVEEAFGVEHESGGEGEGEYDSGSGSDWTRSNRKRQRQKKPNEKQHQQQQQSEEVSEEEVYHVENLIRRSSSGSRVEVKWAGYGTTTWEPRTSMMKDVPDMVVALDAEVKVDVDVVASKSKEGEGDSERLGDKEMTDV